MTTESQTPGVIIHEDATPAISVTQNATAIPLFIGRFSPKAVSQSNNPARYISNWLDYTKNFDQKQQKTLGAVISITSKKEADSSYKYESISLESISVSTPSAALQLYFQNGGGPCYLYPLSDTSNTEELASLPEKIQELREVTLLACLESDTTYRKEVYNAVTTLINDTSKAGIFLLADAKNISELTSVAHFSHAAAYYPPVQPAQVITPNLPDNNNISINGYQDNTHTDSKAITLAQLTTLIDTQAPEGKKNGEPQQKLANDIMTKLRSEIEKIKISLPVSALIAGVYCKTDLERGVWKAPANVALSGINDIAHRVSDAEQDKLNKDGINVVRYFSDRGFIVWGARTLNVANYDWRYIPVRRLFDAVERDIKQALRPMVFEPNSQPTWKRIQAALNNYFHTLWQQGALAGNKPEEAWFVKIGKGITMTDSDIKNGLMNIQIGMAAVRPAEFIVLHFTQEVAK